MPVSCTGLTHPAATLSTWPPSGAGKCTAAALHIFTYISICWVFSQLQEVSLHPSLRRGNEAKVMFPVSGGSGLAPSSLTGQPMSFPGPRTPSSCGVKGYARLFLSPPLFSPGFLGPPAHRPCCLSSLKCLSPQRLPQLWGSCEETGSPRLPKTGRRARLPACGGEAAVSQLAMGAAPKV